MKMMICAFIGAALVLLVNQGKHFEETLTFLFAFLAAYQKT